MTRPAGMGKRSVWAWLRMLGGAGILGVLVWRLGSGAFLDGLRRIDAPTLLSALVLGLLTTVFSAWRWCLVARGLGLRLPLGRAVADYYRALFLNAALPGGVLGDVHRAVRHGRSAGDLGRGVRAVVLERTAGQVVLLVAGTAVLLLRPSPALAQAGRLLGTPAGWVSAAVVASAAIAVAYWSRGASRAARAVRTALAEARRALFARASWPGVTLSSVVVLAGYLAMFVLAARVAGVSAPVAELVPLVVLALLAMALPLNVGGWGPREGVAAWAFGAAGLGAAQGLASAVVYGVLAFAASLPGAGVLVVRWAAGLRARRAADTAAAEPAPTLAEEAGRGA
ncbi:lysylphosphatidylglycerol synthase transmembrane domain-containing protein [Streptomyces gilvosporeus]|uniref:Dolichol-P-glucose synthetase-like protein n=1 Tax=Streptomyces gilvosporeus TaxID=553510 RepID=A0A1V0TMA1_9ACTN|nr:lysylphosphatidylglycerol synthase transmembrane domain-containing protein [Streptomyces gilvosporeus]ARF54033.1 dolichol-P-glucose synthetase-like protein [Streptomyces gilvosporeus]